MLSPMEDTVRSTLEGESAQPDRIGPYRFQNLLGVGGMGAVYRAWDERLDRWVAVKRIRPTALADETTRARFRREALAVAQLSHPAIVPIFDLLQTEDGDWIVMECVEGTNLSTLIQEHLLSTDQTLLLVRDIAEGLSEAHSKGVIHCDLKTENVLVTPSGRARILDFGLARQLSRSELPSKEGVLIGTARAMSPEQVRLQEVDHRADIFSLGTLFYEALTGKNPFAGRTPVETLMHIVHDRPLPVHELCPEVPEAVSLLIERMHAKEADQRPQSAGEVVAALDAITGPVVREVPAPAMSSPDDARTIVATLLASELASGPATWQTPRRNRRRTRHR